MADSSSHDYPLKASVGLLIVAALLAGAWVYHNWADFASDRPPEVRQSPSSPPAPPSSVAEATTPRALLPVDARTDSPPRHQPPQSLAPATDSLPPAEASPSLPENSPSSAAAPLETPPADGAANRSDGQEANNGRIAAQRGPEEPAKADISEAAPPAAPPDEPGEDPVAGRAPLIVYGKGSAADAQGRVIVGEIPARQVPPDTSGLYGSPVPAGRKDGRRRVSPQGEDTVVGLAFVQDLAKFLADNYWPAGTHPRARRRGISTATLKWANAIFGARLQGFSLNRNNIPQERLRVLNYAFMPSMIRSLYELYAERFLDALEREALSRRFGPGNRPPSKVELAEMYSLYATMAKGLAGTARAYADTPGALSLARSCVEADDQTEEANRRFIAAARDNAPAKAALERQYRAAVLRREQQRDALALALRARGAQGPDNESMVYAALWIYRRGEGSGAATRALADVLNACAAALEAGAMETRRASPPRKPGSSSDPPVPRQSFRIRHRRLPQRQKRLCATHRGSAVASRPLSGHGPDSRRGNAAAGAPPSGSQRTALAPARTAARRGPGGLARSFPADTAG